MQAPITSPLPSYVIDIRDGTTDFTRTIHFGLPTDLEREIYTRLLKGILAIEATAFPEGTTGILPFFMSDERISNRFYNSSAFVGRRI
jgi:Xaa-Pro aminopeptidase